MIGHPGIALALGAALLLPANPNVQRVAIGGGSSPVTESGTWTVGIAPQTSGGLLWSSRISTSGTNATTVKASPGQVFHVTVLTNGTAIAYLKLYNKSTAPVCGTDTPVDRFVVPAPASGGGGFEHELVNGAAYAAGIGYCLTGAIADADTTAVAANAFTISVYFK